MRSSPTYTFTVFYINNTHIIYYCTDVDVSINTLQVVTIHLRIPFDSVIRSIPFKMKKLNYIVYICTIAILNIIICEESDSNKWPTILLIRNYNNKRQSLYNYYACVITGRWRIEFRLLFLLCPAKLRFNQLILL